MSTYDWSRFTKRIEINASTEQLYNAWTTRNGIESWFLRLSEIHKPDGSIRDYHEQAEVDDTYRWLWHGWPDSATEKGKILEANHKDVFKFTFGGDSDSPIVVTVNIKKEKDIQLVELTQENIPTDEHGKTQFHLGCTEGWNFYLVNMKSIFEGGIDLRSRNEELQNVVNK